MTVYFEKWQDKDDILRKANMLRGVNVYIGEDFSKRIRDQVRLQIQGVPLENMSNIASVSETRITKVPEAYEATQTNFQIQLAIRQIDNRQ